VRTDHTLILDAARRHNFMFGGQNPIGAKLGDTWTYLSGQWTQLAPANAPSARSGHAMAYDPSTDTGVLVGGEDASGTVLADMWRWDGTDWTQANPTTLPPARHGHELAWDPLRARLVLFGGQDGSARRNDIWEWDGTDWAEITPRQQSSFFWGPSPRDAFAMAYDPRSERVVVHGGETDAGCADDFWSWDGVEWTRHFATGTAPSARSGHAMFFDPAVNELRVFGGACGTPYSNELWKIELPVFHRLDTFGAGCTGTAGVPNLDAQAGTRPVTGETFVVELTNLPSSPASIPFALTGFSKTRWAGGTLPLDLAILGMPGCALLTSSDDTVTLPNQGGQASYALAIPSDPTLLGNFLYMQGAVFDRFANPLGLVFSNGLEFRIGDS
ncbi:MAG: Kelch repeat-containing protein, partial [Planctomycetota bacterium]